MPNQITAAGLETSPYAELLSYFTTAMQTIYGADINLESDTPDGQWIDIIIQSVLDNEDLCTQVFNSFDPDLAIGIILDQRCAINGVMRQAGTRTITNITVVTDRALTLYGVDQTVNPIYTIADNAGNNWQLVTTVAVSGSGSHVYIFQAQNPGAVLTVPNTITIPVTVILGVTSLNNPTTYTTLGLNEETDAALRLRRIQSVSLSSQGYLAGLRAALLNINGVTYAQVYENNTGSTDADSIPGHSIWVITNGGEDADIAQAIYQKRNAGCGMKGAVTYTITQADGTLFVVKWDVVTAQNLYINFSVSSLNGVDVPDASYIKNQLVLLFTPGIHQQVNINDLATIVQEIDPNALVTGAGFSLTAGSYTNTLTPSAKNQQFAVDAARIAITIV